MVNETCYQSLSLFPRSYFACQLPSAIGFRVELVRYGKLVAYGNVWEPSLD